MDDDLLLMDVARYKYPPLWVETNLQWQAMATTDTSSGRYRGFIVLDAVQYRADIDAAVNLHYLGHAFEQLEYLS